jgi:hypothetical protein
MLPNNIKYGETEEDKALNDFVYAINNEQRNISAGTESINSLNEEIYFDTN